MRSGHGLLLVAAFGWVMVCLLLLLELVPRAHDVAR